MQKRSSSGQKLDAVQNARRVIMEATETTTEVTLTVVSQVMSEMGRKGGLVGGKRRLETMTSKQRSAVAKKAAKARWKKAKQKA